MGFVWGERDRTNWGTIYENEESGSCWVPLCTNIFRYSSNVTSHKRPREHDSPSWLLPWLSPNNITIARKVLVVSKVSYHGRFYLLFLFHVTVRWNQPTGKQSRLICQRAKSSCSCMRSLPPSLNRTENIGPLSFVMEITYTPSLNWSQKVNEIPCWQALRSPFIQTLLKGPAERRLSNI